MTKSIEQELKDDWDDPDVFMPGKPIKSSINGSLPYYRSYWFISDNSNVNLEPIYLSVKRVGKIEKILGRLK